MPNQTRSQLELEIRQLSAKISADLLEQQQQGIIPSKPDLSTLEKMMDKWYELAKYYQNSIYEREKDEDADTTMSLFLVANFLTWREKLLTFMSGARKRGEDAEMFKLEDILDSLEAPMKIILEAGADLDEFGQGIWL